MATYEYKLAAPPQDSDDREMWLQHAAGFILFEDARKYALERMGKKLSPSTRTAVQKGIDDTIYGLMMVLDGVSGALSNEKQRVEFQVLVRLMQLNKNGDAKCVAKVDLADGEGMCMGYHGWLEGDFGEDTVAVEAEE